MGTSHASGRRRRENHSGRVGLAPGKSLERPSFSHNRRALVGGQAFLIDGTQAAAWEVTGQQDLGSLTRKIILFRD